MNYSKVQCSAVQEIIAKCTCVHTFLHKRNIVWIWKEEVLGDLEELKSGKTMLPISNGKIDISNKQIGDTALGDTGDTEFLHMWVRIIINI